MTAGFAGVARPLQLRMHTVCSPVFHCYSCPLATYACPIGGAGELQCDPCLAAGRRGDRGGLRCAVWQPDLRLGLPLRFPPGLAGADSGAEVRPPFLAGLRALRGAAAVLAYPRFFGEGHPLFFCRLCPAGALEARCRAWPTQAIVRQPIAWPSAVKITILTVFFVAALFTWRPWCTVLCPLGAIYSLFNYVSLLYVRFRPEDCNDCELCRKICRHRERPNDMPGGPAEPLPPLPGSAGAARRFRSAPHSARRHKRDSETIR